MAFGVIWSFFSAAYIFFSVRDWGLSPMQVTGLLALILFLYVFFLARTKIALTRLN